MSRNESTLAIAIGGWMSGAIYHLTGSYQAAFNGIPWNLPNMPVAFWLLPGRLRPRPRSRDRGLQGDEAAIFRVRGRLRLSPL